ncbi:MAG: arylesterase [bacterium]|nr:arylesterase [bacterium]
MWRKLYQPGARLALLTLLFVAQGCEDAPARDSKPEGAAEARASKTDTAAAHEVAPDSGGPVGKVPRVLFLGTSLTAGLGLSEDEAYPARLAELLEERGRPIEAVNAGVSGDTSAGGLNRLDWLLRVPPDIIVIELGANDGLRGLPVEMTEANLLEAIARGRKSGARVLIAGMIMPPNYGEDYARDFAEIFPRVAEETGSALIPFLLEGVAADPDLNLPDGIHPNVEGHRRIAETLLPFLVEVLETGAAA